MRRILSIMLCLLLLCACSSKAEPKNGFADGDYLAKFDTDSSMFHLNETCNGRAILHVAEGEMTMHLIMPSKNVVNLYAGLVAELDETKLLQPMTQLVTYPDGLSEEVYAFDLPVPVLDEEFDCALIGTKGNWYDHKVKVSDPQPCETAEVTLAGGTGKASITSPAIIEEREDGKWIRIVWSSENYAAMTLDGVEYQPVSTKNGSTFWLPCKENTLSVSALTTAMSEPHWIDYTITVK